MRVFLPVAGVEVGVLPLAALGFVVGCLSGFFGVGGGFLVTPMLNVFFGVPYPAAVGSGLCQMLGACSAGCLRHRTHGTVDFRLGLILAAAMIPGGELGVRALELLKRAGSCGVGGASMDCPELVMSVVFIALLGWTGALMWRESQRAVSGSGGAGAAEGDRALSRSGARLMALRLPPFISLPASGVDSVSLWLIVGMGLATGFLSGLLGLGGGFVLLPAMVYVLGVPTTVAVGTSLLNVAVSSAYLTLAHAMRGNVDLLLVAILIVPASIGTQIGAGFTALAGGPRIRQAFSVLALAVMLIVAAKLAATAWGFAR